jgi:hypothetical protein
MAKSPPPGAPRKPATTAPGRKAAGDDAKPAAAAQRAKARGAPAKAKKGAKQGLAASVGKIPLEPDLPLEGIATVGRTVLPGLGAPARSAPPLPGAKAPPKLELKKPGPLVPGKAFDPKGADWKNRHGHGQVTGGPPPTRPFKGGGRGR